MIWAAGGGDIPEGVRYLIALILFITILILLNMIWRD